jgi:hypothetical protein
MEFDETSEWANKEREPIKTDQICFSTQSFFLSIAGIAVVMVAVILIFISGGSEPSSKSETIANEEEYEENLIENDIYHDGQFEEFN